MGGNLGGLVLLIVLAGLIFSTIGFLVAVVWDALRMETERRATRLAVRYPKALTPGWKVEPGEMRPSTALWDRELDG